MLGSLTCRICQFHNMGFTHSIFSHQYIQATAKRDFNILKHCKIFCFYLCQRHFKHLFYQSILLSDYYCTIPSQFHQPKNFHNRKKDSSPAFENESPVFLFPYRTSSVSRYTGYGCPSVISIPGTLSKTADSFSSRS